MHNIHYRDYPENINKKDVQAEWDHYAAMEDWQEGATGLGSPIRWINETYNSYEEAQKAIEKHDKGWYDQLAVKYVDRHKNKDDSKMKALTEASVEAMNEYNRRDRIIYPQTLQASLITCKKCNSKLAKSYLKSNLCPVCRTDLRPEHILKSIESAKNKWDRKQRDIKDYMTKHGKKEIRWVVKIECHT